MTIENSPSKGGALAKPIAPLAVTTAPTRIKSSLAHGWRDTLAFDIAGTSAGQCRHEHEHLCLQLWWQPLAMRPLPGGSWRCVEPGARLWLPGEQQHFEWRRRARVNIVFIRPERVEHILERPYSKTKLEAWRELDFCSPFVSGVMAAIADDIVNDCPAGPIVGDSLTTALVAHLVGSPGEAERADSRSALSAQGFDRALQYIEANLAQPLRVAELAEAAGCNPRQMSRAFRERKGKLPHDYVIEKRVQRATALIETAQFNLAQIAAAVGFADQSQMTKMFRKVLGTTPGRWRKRPGTPNV